ncbi:hypothetical protein DRN63_00860 [Nanoarchaeota archaeon]|nr:MAG: hypothetical protein DRN63_00860 [Nanoarchaeota archaeon]
MSVIIENAGKISLISGGARYGVRPLYGSGILIPVRLESIEEVDQLISEISELEKFLSAYKVTVAVEDLGIRVDMEKKGFFGGKGSLSILPENENSTKIFLKSSPPKEVEKFALDYILRKTILGKKLKTYWIKNGASEKEAQERLDKITEPIDYNRAILVEET